MVIEKLDQYVKRLSHSSAVLAPNPRRVEEVQKTLKPRTDHECDMEYPGVEEVKNNNLTEEGETVYRHQRTRRGYAKSVNA